MKTAWIALGKLGDQLSVFPLIQEAHRKTGQLQSVIVAKAYTSVAERAPGVFPIVWPGDWQDLEGAYRFAKRSFQRVMAPTTYGNGFPIQKRLPSFQLDQWDRVGALESWDRLPLTLERGQETVLQVPQEPFILLGDRSQSSPFEKVADLDGELARNFPGHNIIRSSSLKLANVCDFLDWYDRAACLVSIETAHLHLCKASAVPVVALVADKPSRWHGSAWSSRFKLHVRYSDYENRKADIIRVVQKAVDKSPDIALEPIAVAPKLAYNPSQMQVGDKVWTSWRWHPDGASWRTEMALHDGERTLPVKVDGFDEFSLEDGRLFMFHMEPHLSLTISRSAFPGQAVSPCATGYGQLRCDGKEWNVFNFQRPVYGLNDWNGQEKNLVFFEWQSKLFCIWQVSPEQVILELEGARVIKQWKTPAPASPFGHPRGGTQPFPLQGRWLRFCHANQRNPKSDQWWTYGLVAVVMEPNPPFKVIQVSKQPILLGTEQFFPSHKFWKPRVLFPLGAVAVNGGWRVSLGLNDSACVTALITEKDLNL